MARRQNVTPKRAKSSASAKAKVQAAPRSKAAKPEKSPFDRLRYLQTWKRMKNKEAQAIGKNLKDYLDELNHRQTSAFVVRVREAIAETEIVAEDAREGAHLFQLDEDSDRMERYQVEDRDDDLDSLLRAIDLDDE